MKRLKLVRILQDIQIDTIERGICSMDIHTHNTGFVSVGLFTHDEDTNEVKEYEYITISCGASEEEEEESLKYIRKFVERIEKSHSNDNL